MTRSIFSPPREGFHIGHLFRILDATLCNPWPHLGVLIFTRTTLARYFPLWHDQCDTDLLSKLTIFSLAILLFGTCVRVNDFLNRLYLNSFVVDKTWDWSRELVLVTGGSSGIGASVVRQLLARNIKTELIIVDCRPLQFELPQGANVHFYKCDLSDSEAIKPLCEQIREECGSPNVLINNAGLTRGRSVIETSYQDVDVTFRTNIIAQFILIKEFLPSMVKRNHGHILAVASMSAIISPGGLADYAATKAGIAALQDTLRQELRFTHNAPKVRISTAILGFIRTPMFKGYTNQPHFISPLLEADTVGEAIVDALYSAESQNIWLPETSRVLACLRGGPDWVMELVRNKTQQLKVDYAGYQKIDPKTGKVMF